MALYDDFEEKDPLSPDSESSKSFGLRLFKSAEDAMREDVRPREPRAPAAQATPDQGAYNALFGPGSAAASASAMNDSSAYQMLFGGGGQEAPKKEPGLDLVGSVKKGFKGLGLTWDFLANRLEKAVTGDTKDTAPILQKGVEEYNQIASDPRIAQMVKEADQTYDDQGLLPAAGVMLSWMARNPTMVANFLAEQIPGAVVGGGIGGIAAAPLREGAVTLGRQAAVSLGAKKTAVRAAGEAAGAGAMGAAVNTSAVVFQSLGTNYTEGLDKFDGDTEAASDYAVKKTLAEVPANAVAGAFIGINPFKSKIANVLNQANIQGIGGAVGAASASLAVGEKPSFGELALEYLGEGLTAPGEIAGIGVEKFREARKEQGDKAPPNPISDRNAGEPPAGIGLSPNQMLEFVNDSRSVPFFAAVYQNADDATKTKIEQAMGRSDQLEAFQQAISNVQSIEEGNRLVASNGDFTNVVLGSLDEFLTTTPPMGVYKTTPASLARVATEEANAGSDENLASLDQAIQADRAARELEREDGLRAGSPAIGTGVSVAADDDVSSVGQTPSTTTVSQTTDGSTTAQAEQATQEAGAQQQVADATVSAAPAAEQSAEFQVAQDAEADAAAAEARETETDSLIDPGQLEQAAGTTNKPQAAAPGEAPVASGSRISVPAKTASEHIDFIAQNLTVNSEARGNGPVAPEQVRLAKLPTYMDIVAKALKIDLVGYYAPPGSTLRGFSDKTSPAIYINAAKLKDINGMFLLGHEVYHQIEARNPDLIKDLSGSIVPYLKSNYKKYADGLTKIGYDKSQIDSEISADVMGLLFNDRDFWMQVGKKNPTLLETALETINTVIDNIKEFLGVSSNKYGRATNLKKYLSDYEVVRDTLSSVIADLYQGRGLEYTADGQIQANREDMVDQVRELLSQKKISEAAKLFRDNNLRADGYDFNQILKESGSAKVISSSVVKTKPAGAQVQSGSTNAVPNVRTEDSTQPAASAPTDLASERRVKESEDRLKTANMPGREIVVPDFEAIAQRVRDLFAERKFKDAKDLFNKNSLQEEGYTLNGLKEEADKQVKQAERKAKEEANRKEPTAENVIRSRVRRLMTAGDIGQQGRQDIERLSKADTEDKANQGPKSVDDLEDKGRFADTLFEREDDAEGKSDAEAARSKRLSDERIDAERKLLKRRAKEVADNPDVMLGELLNIKSEAQAAGLSAETIADIFDTPMAQIKALANGLLSEVKSEEQLTDVTDETNVEQQPVEVGDPITTIGAARNAVQTIKEGLSGGKMTIDQIVRVLQLARKDANFSIGELVYVMEQEGIEIPSVFDRLNGRPFMTPFVDFVSSSPNHPVARQQWFNSLDRALNQSSTQERNFINGTLLTAVERELYQDWKAKRDRAPTDSQSKDVRQVFPNALFTKFSLTQMRNPNSIPQGMLPLSVRSGIVDFVADWYADVSNALTYRPDMARQILGALAPQDLKAFTAWRKAQQRATMKKAEVIGRSVDYGNLMGLRFIGPALTGAYKEQLALADSFMAKEAMAWAVRIDGLIEQLNQDTSLTPEQRKQAIRDVTYNELKRIHKTIGGRARKLADTSEKSDSFANWVAEKNEQLSSPERQEGRTEEGDYVAIDEQSTEEPMDDDPATRLGDALFRLGNGPIGSVGSTVLVQSQVSELMGGFKSAANVVVVGNPSHLPDGVRERLMKRLTNGFMPKGLYDAQTGTIYVFSEAATSEHDTQFTLFHELFGHFGLRAFLGETYTDYFNSLYNGNKAIREAANRQKEGRNISNAVAVEEALSDMAGEGKYAGVIKGVVGKIIKALRDSGFEAVANWLSKYTDAEVMHVLREARNAARNGGTPVLNGAPADVLLSEVRMPYEMYSTSNGETSAYARYNPVTMQWYVFTPKQGSNSIGQDYQSTTMPHDQFNDVLAEMKRHGKVMRRMRSGLFIDNRIPNDNVVIQDPRDGGWFKRAMYWAAIRAQNEYLPIFKVVEQLEKMGRMADFMNPMKALKLMERRTAARLEKQVEQKYIEPITALLRDGGTKGMTYDDVNRFLLARFAPVRNAQIAKINPDMNDGGSGMKTKDAYDALAEYARSPYATQLNAIAALMDQMSNDKLNGLVRDGMITVEEAQKMKAAYPYGYVNLSGQDKVNSKFDEDIDPMDLAGGRKLNLRGKEKRAMGRGEGNIASDILARTAASYEAAIIRGEKNRVAQTVLAMVESNPDPNFAMVNTQAWKREIGDDGIVREVLDKEYIRRPDVFVAKVRGIPVTIEFQQMGDGTVAQALHGSVYPPEANALVNVLRTFNNKIGQLITTYNPAWAGVNFVRDVQTMYFNAASDGRITTQMARTMLRDLPKAIRTSLHVAGWPVQPDPRWLEAFNQMKEDGGLTGFSMRESLEDKVKDIERALSGKDKTPLAKIGDFMEKITLPMEMATRLAAYKTVRDNGFTRTDAAIFSGEITVDFNARGSAQGLRAMYLFFNPAIQGTAKMYRLMRDNPKQVAKYAFALASLGALTNLVGRALGGQGEDGEDKLDQLPTFKRQTSVVLIPDVPGGAIPIAYGWNAFYAVGHFGVDWMLGKQSLGETTKRIGTTFVEAFLPAGSSGLESKSAIGKVAKGLTPTAGQPILEYLMNENRYGAPIKMSGSTFGGAQMPESEMAFRSTNPVSRSLARAVNEFSGGTRHQEGALSFNPAAIDHFLGAYVPGLATEAYKGVGLGVRAARGEEIARTPLPLIDRFSAYPPEGFDAGAFRRAATFVDTKWQAMTKTEDEREREQIKRDYPELGPAKRIVQATESTVRKLNSEIRFLDNTTKIPEEERVQRINEKREQLKKIYGNATKKLSELGGEYREAIRAN